MICAISQRLSALAAAHGGPLLARPAGQTVMGHHGGMAPVEEVVSPCVRPSWDDRGDTAVTRYRVLRRDADARGEAGSRSSTAPPARPRPGTFTVPSRTTCATSSESERSTSRERADSQGPPRPIPT